MAEANTEEGTHTLPDGVKLYTKTWKAVGEHKANVVFVHGFSDHCNTYGSLFPHLASNGIQVYGFDQRGWGRSVHKQADKGDTGPTATVVADITSFVKSVLPSPVPLFLMGHSMGGAEILTYAAVGPEDVRCHFRGYLAESPFIVIAAKTRPSALTVTFGRLAANILPHFQLKRPIDPKLLSRDPEVVKAYREDKLCHETGTLEGLAGMLDRASNLEKNTVQISNHAGELGATNLWVAHGTGDHVCDFTGTKKWFDSLKLDKKEFKTYDGWYHKLHSEPGEDKQIFANDVAAWVLARVAEPKTVGPAATDPASPKL